MHTLTPSQPNVNAKRQPITQLTTKSLSVSFFLFLPLSLFFHLLSLQACELVKGWNRRKIPASCLPQVLASLAHEQSKVMCKYTNNITVHTSSHATFLICMLIHFFSCKRNTHVTVTVSS